MVEQAFDITRRINCQGMTIFTIERNANMARAIADRVYVLQTGQGLLSGAAAEVRETKLVRQAYLGKVQVQ